MANAWEIERDRLAARFDLVDRHIRCENAHDIDGIMGTFGADARYQDEPWGERYSGPAEVRSYYESLLAALPDLAIEVQSRFASSDAVAYEVVVAGTHGGRWRGISATGRRVRFPLMAVYDFGSDERLAGERIYYDRASVLRQIGLYHEPDTLAGRLAIAATHPLTIMGAQLRRLWRRAG